MKNQTHVLWILVLLLVTIILLACDITISLGGQATAVAVAATSTLTPPSPTPAVLVVTATPPLSTPTPLPPPSSTPTKTPTPLPPAATPVPTAETITLGNILFQDSLASNINKWNESTHEENYSFQDGKYHIALLTSSAYAIWGLPDQHPRIQDFVLEVEGTLVEGSDTNGYGVSFRQIDEAFYFFEISGNGSFRLRKNEAKWTTLIDWTPHPAILTGKRTNALRVVAKGNTFSFYVNGTKVGTWNDSSFPDGTFGTVVSNNGSGGVAHAAFDNLTVWKLGPSPSATTKVPTPEEFTKGEIFFQDDFATNKAGWVEGAVRFNYFFQDGKYHISVFKPGGWLPWGYPLQEPRFKDFVLEVEATPLEGPDTNDQGVFFRRTENDYYYFQIIGDGSFAFYKYIKGRWTALIPKTPNAAIQSGKRPNVLKVAAKGTSFSFFVNGKKVGAFSDDSLPDGTIALAVGSGKQGLAHAAFANLKVWELLTK